MKKILTILFLFVCLIGFGQRTYYLSVGLSLTVPSYQEILINVPPGMGTVQQSYYTAVGEPNLSQFNTGTYTAGIWVETGNIYVTLKVNFIRVNDSYVEVEASGYSGEQATASGTPLSFSFSPLSWATGNTSDRLKVVYTYSNYAGTTQSITVRRGTGYSDYSKVVTPFSSYVRKRIYLSN